MVAQAGELVDALRASHDYRFDPDRFRRLHVPTLLVLGGASGAMHRAALCLPNFVKALLAQPAEPLSAGTSMTGEVVATEDRGYLEVVERSRG